MLPHLAARLFGTPLLIHQPKLEVILSVLGPRLGLPERAGQGGYVRPEHPVNESPSGIAVIPIHGSLVRRTSGLEADSGLTSYQSVQQMLDVAHDDPSIQAILLDIDSPGGESSGVFDLADKIRTIGLQKPVWAVANDMAFSAAYSSAKAGSHPVRAGAPTGLAGEGGAGRLCQAGASSTRRPLWHCGHPHPRHTGPTHLGS